MFAKSPALIILGGICNNISFGLIFPAMREITERNVARNVRNTAHALIDVAYGSFAGMLGLLYSGLLIGRAGIKAMLLMCLVLQAAAVIIQLRAAGIAKTPQENCEKLTAARQ